MDVTSSLSSAYSQFEQSVLPLQIGVQVLSQVKNQVESQGAQMVQMLQQSVQPHLGKSLDIRV